MSKKWSILLTVVVITLMATLDSSIVNVALPIISKDLNVGMSTIEWVVTSYLIIICSIILLFGRLGDIKGKSFIFRNGILVFTIGSLLCSISNTIFFLVFARIVQAVGAAAAMATNQGIITEAFPKEERGRALGVIGSFVAIGTLIGPSLGGVIVDFLKWQYIFIINLPIGVIAYFFSFKTLPKDSVKEETDFDYKGVILFIIFIISLFLGIIFGESLGFTNPIILGAFAVAIISLGIFIKLELNISKPLLDVNIFKNNLFTLSIFCGFISFVAMGGVNIILPFYFQETLRLSPSLTGILMTVSPIILSVVAPLSGYLSDKLGSEKITLFGLTITTLGLGLIGTLTSTSSLIIIAIFLGTMSLGNAMFQSPNNSLVMSTVSRDKLGVAGSINALVRNIGLTTGIALSTTLLYSRMSYKAGYQVLSYIEGRPDIFMYGMKIVFFTMALICFIGVLLTFIRVINTKKSKDYKHTIRK